MNACTVGVRSVLFFNLRQACLLVQRAQVCNAPSNTSRTFLFFFFFLPHRQLSILSSGHDTWASGSDNTEADSAELALWEVRNEQRVAPKHQQAAWVNAPSHSSNQHKTGDMSREFDILTSLRSQQEQKSLFSQTVPNPRSTPRLCLVLLSIPIIVYLHQCAETNSLDVQSCPAQ